MEQNTKPVPSQETKEADSLAFIEEAVCSLTPLERKGGNSHSLLTSATTRGTRL